MAFAQDTKESNVAYETTTEIDFEGLEVEGQFLKPHGSIITERPKATFNQLIQIRTDFNKDMKESVKVIK